jgi:NADH-quinone oxidoreductase subunit M
VIYGIFRLHNAHTLIDPRSTEYSHILSLIVFLPLVAIFFNVISPAKNLFFIRMNTVVYALIIFSLSMFMLFGYEAAKTDDGKLIYKDQAGNQLTITAEGIYNPIIAEGAPEINYTIVDNVQMIEVDGENEPIRPVLIKNYYYDRTKSGMQFEELRPWVNVTDRPALNIGESEYTIAKFQFHLGVDGISFPLIILTALLSVLSLIASFSITMRLKEYMSWFLLLMVGMFGTFCSLDYILFYVFWELILVPMYFLIGIWGGPRKEYAALKFFLYTLFGSVFLLIGIIALYFVTGQQTFDIIMLQGLAATALGTKDMYHIQVLLFLCFFLSFAIKVPIFPFHTWLPDAHVEAPTAVSVILAGVLLKMGTYGFFRMSFPTFPEATYHLAPALGVLAVINIVYGAMVAMAQTDMKKLVAYSSIGHMGFVLLGMAALNKYGFAAAQLQIINHGIISGSLFLLVGVLYDRAHTRDLNAFGGLLPQMRMYGIIMVIASMANLGLPGLAGFWGEFLSLLAAVQQKEFLTSNGFVFFRILAPIALIGIIITAAYMLLMIRKVFMGPVNEKWSWLPDMDARELIAVLPLIALMIYIGVYPNPLIYLFQTNVLELVNQIRYAAGVMPSTF